MSWRKFSLFKGTIFECIGNNINQLLINKCSALPDLSEAKTLLLFSDYGGECKNSPYNVYSFLIIADSSFSMWENARILIRERYFHDNRRMSYKNLNDSIRKKTLKDFLTASDYLNGISFTFAINKKIGSIFTDKLQDQVAADGWGNIKKQVKIKMAVVTHLLAFVLCGVVKKGQNIMWFTDCDDIASNDSVITLLTTIFGNVVSNIIDFDLGSLKCGTAKCDRGDNQIEDLLSIPDIISGMVSEQFSKEKILNKHIFFINRSDLTEKTNRIAWWYSNTKSSLKRYLAIIDPGTTGHLCSLFHFYDQQ